MTEAGSRSTQPDQSVGHSFYPLNIESPAAIVRGQVGSSPKETPASRSVSLQESGVQAGAPAKALGSQADIQSSSQSGRDDPSPSQITDQGCWVGGHSQSPSHLVWTSHTELVSHGTQAVKTVSPGKFLVIHSV